MSEARSTVRAGALRINAGKGWAHPLGIREAGGGRGGGRGKGKGMAVFLCLDDLSLCLSGETGQPHCVWCWATMLLSFMWAKDFCLCLGGLDLAE